MPATAAQIEANRRNAARSCGPKTPEGKMASRANALKHGMTGAGVVLPNEDAAEVERRFAALEGEIEPTHEMERILVRRIAVSSVRMDRGVEQETAHLAERVRQAEADFAPPEGASPEEAARLRAEAGRRAMFDPSREATLARRYEMAAERSFHKAIKELRQLRKEQEEADAASAPPASGPPAFDIQALQGRLASFLSGLSDAEADDLYERVERGEQPFGPSWDVPSPTRKPSDGHFDVPFTIGKGR